MLTYLTRGYSVAVLSMLLAALVTLWAGSWADRIPFTLFLCAVMVSAYFGGARAGVLATTVAATFLVYQFTVLRPQSPSRPDGDFLPSLILFVLVGVLGSYLSWECLRSVKEAMLCQQTFSKIPGAVVLTNAQGRITFLNAEARSLTGWPGAAAVQEPLEKVFQAVEEHSSRPVSLARLLHVGSGAATAMLRAQDSTEKPVEYWAEPRQDTAGRPAGIVLVFRDISARRRQEEEWQQRAERFSTLAACAPAGMILLDRDGRCTFSNAAWQASTGCTGEESLGDGWVRFLHPEDRAVASEWTAAARAGRPYASEFRLQNAPGQIRWVRLRADAARTAKGQVLGSVGTFEELADLKQLEQELAEHKQTVDNLGRSQAEYARKAENRLAALHKARDLLQEQLTAKQRAEEELRQAHARDEAAWKQAAERLRVEAADLATAHGQAQERLLEGRRVEEQLRREIAGLAQANQQAQAQLAQRQRAEEEHGRTLTRRQAEARQAEEKLRREIAALVEANQQAQRQLAEAQQREANVRKDHLAAHADQQRVAEQLRRQQDFLSQALGHAEVGLLAWAEDRTLQVVNAAARAFLGLPEGPPPPDQWGQYFQLFYPAGRTPDPHDTPFGQALQGNAFPNVEIEVVPKAGAARTLLASGVKLPDGNGNRLGYVLTLQDVTAHKQTANELRELHRAECQRSQEELERWQREQAALALAQRSQHQEACEDLRRQITTLQEAVRLAEDRVDRWTEGLRPVLGRLREAVHVVRQELDNAGRLQEPGEWLEQQVRRLTMTLDDLWVITRLARGDLTLRREPVELGTWIQQAVAASCPLLHTRGQHLTVSLPLGPEWVLADAARLDQVLVHLLDHVASSSEPGGAIRLTAERTRGEIVVRVQQPGSGMAAEETPDAAESPAQIEWSDDGDADGWGIGLALVRGLVDLHGGKVRVVSIEPAGGREWSLHLPLPVQGTRELAVLALPAPAKHAPGPADVLAEVGPDVLEAAS